MPRVPFNSDIQIFLALSFPAAYRMESVKNTIFIIPEQTSFNDFGKFHRVSLYVITENNPVETFSMRFMAKGHDSAHAYFANELGLIDDHNGKSWMEIDKVSAPFVSILRSENDYRKFVALLGFKDAIACLRRMHDAVLAHQEKEPEDAETLELTKTAEFYESPLRDEVTWTAFRHAARYLTPHDVADVHDAARSFRIQSNTLDTETRYSLDADFGEEFPLARRTLVLVGRNGVGKTRLFEAIIQGLQIRPPWEENDDLKCSNVTFDPRPVFSRLVVFSSVATDSYPRFLPPWEGIDYRYHQMIGAGRSDNGELTEALIDCVRAQGDPESAWPIDAMDLLESVINPLGINDSLYMPVEALGENNILPKAININGGHYMPLFKRMNEQRNLHFYAHIKTNVPPVVWTEEDGVRHLSSGEIALMRFAVYAATSLRRGTVFLFDEPETHLHPNYISRFMDMLDSLLEQSGSIALIATHSAYIVREVPRRRVRMMTRDYNKRSLVIDSPVMQTFGASVDTISQFVFGDIGPEHRFQRVLEAYVTANPTSTLRQIRERFLEDLNPETLSYLAELVRRRESH